FHFASDGNGGTLIYDPPASPNAAAASKAAAETPVELGHNFVFRPGLGADTTGNFGPMHDAIGFNHFANPQTVGQLTQFIGPDDYSHAGIEPGYHSDLTPLQFEAARASTVHLH